LQRGRRATAHGRIDHPRLSDAARRRGGLLPGTEPAASAGSLRPELRHARGQIDSGARGGFAVNWWSGLMELDPVVLARAQFAFTISFHFIFPAFSIGLASYLMVLEA